MFLFNGLLDIRQYCKKSYNEQPDNLLSRHRPSIPQFVLCKK